MDRLSLSFAVDRFDHTRFTSEGVVRHADGGASVARRYGRSWVGEGRWKGVTAFVGVLESPGRGWIGKVECNPSRFFDPEGCGLVSPEAAAAFLPDFLEGMTDFMGIVPVAGCEEWRVKRVDFARDFHGVTAPGVMIEGLRPIRRLHARMASVHHDPRLGGAQTLTVGSASGLVRLYDQHAAYADKGAEPGDVRWELQARSGWLEKAGIEVLDDLTPAKVRAYAKEKWEWSKMGTEVTGRVNVAVRIDGLVRSGELSPAKAQRLLGQLVGEAAGLTWASDRKTVREYEQVKERLGVIPSADCLLDVPDAAVRARLDWETGFEVLAA